MSPGPLCLKAICWVAAFVLLGLYPGLRAEETTVEIHNIDDRVRATITSPKVVLAPVEAASIEKPILAVEDTTIDVAGQSTKLVGRGTDAAVGTVQKVGDSFFARFFKTLDQTVRQKGETHGGSQKEIQTKSG